MSHGPWPGSWVGWGPASRGGGAAARPAADSENAGDLFPDDIGCSLTRRSHARPPDPHGAAPRRTGPGFSGSLGAGDWVRSAQRLGFARRGEGELASFGAG